VDQTSVGEFGWPGAPLVLRTSWGRALGTAGLHAAVTIAVPLLIFKPQSRGASPADLPIAVAVTVLVLGFLVAMQRRNIVVIGFGWLKVRSGYRTHTIPAADIQAVTLDRVLGSRVVTVWIRTGKARRASAAGRTDGVFRQHFERDWRRIGDWWLASRGTDWQPGVPQWWPYGTAGQA
jgi:hypothetical protein